jgi:hypothetical protein
MIVVEPTSFDGKTYTWQTPSSGYGWSRDPPIKILSLYYEQVQLSNKQLKKRNKIIKKLTN